MEARGRLKLLVSMIALLGVSLSAASAETVEQFYNGKTVKLLVGGANGGGYDIFARAFAPYLVQYLPGHPHVIVQNVPGVGGIMAAGQIAQTMPRDGTVIAALQSNTPLDPLLGSAKDVPFDPLKLNWLGSLTKETNITVAWHTARVKTVDDLFTTEMLVGSSGAGTDATIYSALLNKTLGTKLKVVSGYRGGNEIDIAMERGEVEGRASMTLTTLRGSHPDWLRDGKVRIIVQLALARDSSIPEVPSIMEFVKNEDDRRLYALLLARLETGRPYALGPDVPDERVKALRDAFAAAANDPRFGQDIERRGGGIQLLAGDKMQEMIEKLYHTAPSVVEKARELIAEK